MKMDRFHIIEEAAAILCVKGRYSQAKVYRRGEEIYAGSTDKSLVKLGVSGGTSVPNVSWYGVEGDGIKVDGAVKKPKWVGAE
jgi:hypothetical protein